MLLPLKDMAGNQTGELEVSDAVFDAPFRPHLMHQALMLQLSNGRLGTHKVKTRSEVAGGGRKPWRQKGTGRARQGSTRAAQWVGGGIVFGPRPRKYVKDMPKKMRRAALRSALSVKAQAGQVVVVDGLAMDAPKTKQAVAMLKALGVDGQSVLVVVAEPNVAIQRSFSNLPDAKTLLSGYLNVRDLLGYDTVVFAREAIEPVESWLAVKARAGDSAADEGEVAATAGAGEE